MDIKFERNRIQEYLEKVIDPNFTSFDDKAKNNQFKMKAERYILNAVDESKMESLIKKDAEDYLFSASVSFFNALQNITERNYSWATVELYYVLYYLFRVKLHYEKVAIFRAKGQIYYLEIKKGNAIHSVKGNTHEGVIAIFRKMFPSDLIFSNTIDLADSVEWIKQNREIVNYRSVNFTEPKCFIFFDKYCSLPLLQKNLQMLINDSSFVFAFQPEFAMLGIPLLLLTDITKTYLLQMNHIFSTEKLEYINSIIDELSIEFIKPVLHLA